MATTLPAQRGLVLSYSDWEAAEADALRWLSKPYDGLLGDPPEWIPEPKRLEFHGLRSWLIGRYGEEWVREAFISRLHKTPEVAEFNPRVCDWLDRLVHLWDAVGLGETEGLIALLGESLARDVFTGRRAVRRGRQAQREAVKVRRKNAKENEATVKRKALALEQAGKEPRAIPGIIAAQMGLSAGYIRKLLERKKRD